MPAVYRRSVLVGFAAVLAGCLGDDDSDDADDTEIERTGPMVGDLELIHNFPVVIDEVDTEETVAEVHYHRSGSGEWHYQPLEVPLDEPYDLRISVIDADGAELDLSAGSAYDITYVPPDDEEDPVLSVTLEDHALSLRGERASETVLRFDVTGPDGEGWRTPDMRVVVSEG